MTTPSPQQPDIYERSDDEINLAAFVFILLKRKWLILGGSIACALIVGFYKYSAPLYYQSEALILVSPPIVQPSSSGDEGTQVSEITVSSLEASTYEILAKSDDLMLALADTLKSRLTTKVLEKTFPSLDIYDMAVAFVKDLEVELLQETGQRNVISTTPLLVLRYKSTEKNIPPFVINTWSELFLQRNQGLSSNVTDGFYKNIVLQYEQAKDNLEQKENELAKVNATSNELNRLKTEMSFKSSQLDSSLRTFQEMQTQFEQKQQEIEYVVSSLEQVEINNIWIGYAQIDSIENPLVRNPTFENLVRVIKEINALRADSTLTANTTKKLTLALNDDHKLLRLDFEQKTNSELLKKDFSYVDSLINAFKLEQMLSVAEISSLMLEVSSLQDIIKTKSPVLKTKKSITDNALWEATRSGGSIDVNKQQSLGKYQLVSEETNPVYLDLSQSLAKAEKALLSKKQRVKFLATSIDSMQKRAKELHDDLNSVREAEFAIEEKIVSEQIKLRQERDRLSSYVKLQLHLKRISFNEYRTQYEKLKSRKETLVRELTELRISTRYQESNYTSWREQLTTLSAKVDSLELERRRIERDVSVYQESFSRLARLQEEARIARQQAAGDIQIVSRASIARELQVDSKKFALIAGIISFFCLCTLSLIVEKLKRNG